MPRSSRSASSPVAHAGHRSVHLLLLATVSPAPFQTLLSLLSLSLFLACASTRYLSIFRGERKKARPSLATPSSHLEEETEEEIIVRLIAKRTLPRVPRQGIRRRNDRSASRTGRGSQCGNTLRDRCHLAYTRVHASTRRKPVSGRSATASGRRYLQPL